MGSKDSDYPEELSAWLKSRQAKKHSRQNRHVVAFLAVRGAVKAALEAGYPQKLIWEHMVDTGRLTCRYETFTGHVKRYIKAPVPTPVEPTPKPQPQKAPVPPRRTATQESAGRPETGPEAAKPEAEASGFVFNPRPNLKELL